VEPIVISKSSGRYRQSKGLDPTVRRGVPRFAQGVGPWHDAMLPEAGPLPGALRVLLGGPDPTRAAGGTWPTEARIDA